MVVEDAGHRRRRAPRTRGHLPASALATALALAGHAVGGGRLPVVCVPVLFAVLIAVTSTWLADRVGARRGLWGAVAVLVAGQCAMEGAVSLPAGGGPDHLVLTSVVHALAAMSVAAVLLGTDRVVEDLLATLDRVLPRLRRMLVAPVGAPVARPPMPRAPLPTLRGVHGGGDRSVRGPPSGA